MLGVERNRVSLSPHSEDWDMQFRITKEEMLSILADNIISIHHIGSTAIKGILAKPILDVAVVIKDQKLLNVVGMEAAGYEYCGENGIPGRYLFIKRRDINISTHHIHCYINNHENFKTTVLFCRYLNENPAYAIKYSDLKNDLANKYPNDRIAYSDGKADFINMIINLADIHTSKTGLQK